MSRCVHPVMQHPNDRNAIVRDAEINDVPAKVAATVSLPDVIAGGSELGIAGELIKSGCQIIGVAVRLIDPPFAQCVYPNRFEIADGVRG